MTLEIDSIVALKVDNIVALLIDNIVALEVGSIVTLAIDSIVVLLLPVGSIVALLPISHMSTNTALCNSASNV